MTDRPILFSAPMVRALDAGRKTQTRRICKPANAAALSYVVAIDDEPFSTPGWFGDEEGECSFFVGYEPGDRLWVRESWGINHYAYCFEKIPKTRPADVQDHEMVYFATEDDCEIINEMPRRPSSHMPRWASRLTLTVESVRVERLNDCSEADAIAEGLDWVAPGKWAVERRLPIVGDDPRRVYGELWDTINGAGAWDANPWVVALSFNVQKGNIDQ